MFTSSTLNRFLFASLLSTIHLLQLNISANALPSESFQGARKRFEKNKIFQGANLYLDPLFQMYGFGRLSRIPTPVLLYSTSSPQATSKTPKFQGLPFAFSIAFDRNNTVVVEYVQMEYGALLGKPVSKAYDPRKDRTVLEFIETVWNSDISSDFSQSRFTNSFRHPRAVRKIYQGKRFSYELRSASIGAIVGIEIFPSRFIDLYRIPDEYEDL
jgi:hypothetical protein